MIPAADAERLAQVARLARPGIHRQPNQAEWADYVRLCQQHATEAGFADWVDFADYLIAEQQVIEAQAALRRARQTLNRLRPKEHTA